MNIKETGIIKKATSVLSAVGPKGEVATQQDDNSNPQPEIKAVQQLSPYNALKVFYYMMAVNGEIKPEEEERFDYIGYELDAKFEVDKEYVVNACKKQLEKVVDKDDYYDVVQDGVEEALLAYQESDTGFIPIKLVIWNLLSLAYSDGEYDEPERKLLKYIARKADISKDVYLEMENSYLTVQDIDREMEWIKDTDRPYRRIEKTVKELERREQAIIESARALIYL